MRWSLWIVPSIVFAAIAAGIVLRENAPLRDGVESDTASDQVVAAPRMLFDPLDDEPFETIPEIVPQPTWRITDHGFGGDVLAPSDVPVVAISNTVVATDARPEVQLAANDKPAGSAPPWEVVGQSVGGLPIHIRRYGNVGDATLIVCGIDGNDRIAVKWIDELSRQLNEAPDMISGRRVILLRDPNPDGLTAKQSENRRGVQINRNFPSAMYRPGLDAGPGPASEPETRAILEVIYRFQPTRVIHLQSAGRSEVAANPAARQLAELLRHGRQLAAEQPERPLQAGSLEEFASQTLGAEVLTLRLATGDDWRAAAIGHSPTLLAAAVPKIAEESLAIARSTSISKLDDPADALAPSPFGTVSEISRLDRSGYEELPPPPQASRR